ncbi:hypothetical protein H1R20_g2148, partial [Candolleomyces eurysporus]
MYLKMAIPLESVVPGSTIPLFPEENVKVLSSQVHPLDPNSVPYNFSSTVSPLLHRAACALNLPARSQESFNSAFDLGSTHSNVSTPSSLRASKPENAEMIPPVDPQYTGHILVSGYNISYVLPKVFPNQSLDHEEPYSRASSRARRPSISERNTAQFMAAIDMWVPYVSKPSRHPYLLSIPTPKCLHNHIKLRIFPPNNNTSNSYASLSSIEDEGSSWDLTSEPHVTRSSSTRLARSNSYNHFADDESSDSSTAGFSEGCGIQGTFPSAERIRIRWAKPSKSVNVPGGGRDGRRRVGVKHVKAEMVCVVRGTQPGSEKGAPESVVMDVQYTGSCSGVWFPGVATLLGMDIGLEAKGCDVAWAEGQSPHWDISGGTGFTGFDTGPSTDVPTQPNSRVSSFESNPQDGDLASSNGSANGFLNTKPQASRSNSASSTSSLLRAPLPAAGVGEYSFEASTSSATSNPLNSSPFGTMSSIPSISMSAASIGGPSAPKPPGMPITLHLNINELLPPAKNVFTFTISGTIVLTPRNPLSRISGSRPPSPTEFRVGDSGLVMLPKFTVLAADSEAITTTVRNEIDGLLGAVDVYHATGDIHRDAQAKKTVLQKGGFTKCDTPTISVVTATVMPFPALERATRIVYSVSLQLRVPMLKDSDSLEFGFAHAAGDGEPTPKPPKLQLVSATLDGVPVEVETSVSTEVEVSKYGVGFERMGGKEWLSWIKLKVGALHGGLVLVEYLVKEDVEEKSRKGKEKAVESQLPLLLPTFSMPIGKFEVKLCNIKDFDITIASNLAFQQAVSDGYRLMHFSLEEFFYPQLRVVFAKSNSSKPRIAPFFILTWTLFVIAAVLQMRASFVLSGMKTTVGDYPKVLQPEVEPIVSISTVTVTATSYETITLAAPSMPTSHSPIVLPSPSVTTSRSELTANAPSSSHTTSSSTVTSRPTSTPPDFGLQPLREAFKFSWPEDFTAAREVYEKFVEAAGVVWQFLRKAYHYPLEAP